MTDFQGFQREDGTEVTPEQQAAKAELIGKLTAMSEDERLSREARATYAEKAQMLMQQYRIDEEFVISSGQAQLLPQRFEIVLVEYLGSYYANNFRDNYMQLWREISNHAGLKSHTEYRYDRDDDDALKNRIVAVGYGYEMDIRLAQFLWTSAHLTFATRVDVRVDPKLSDQENCYYMRGSGMERNDIAEMLWGSKRTDGPAHGKVQKLYLAECAKRGEQPTVGGKGFQAARYREAYAEGFCDQFGWRLRDARSAVDSKLGGLVLHGRKERIEEAYYAEWEDRRPEPVDPEERAKRRAANDARWAAQAEEERKCKESGRCSRAKSGECRKHRTWHATAADRARWDRQENAPESKAGRAAGVAAASSVEFRRTGGERTQKAPSAERTALGN
jgi:Protein of unknown function (DUF2786)